MKLKNKKVLVYGLGDSGRAVVKVLQDHDAHVSIYDDDIKYMEYVGFVRDPALKYYDFVVVSPGIKVKGNKLIENFIEREIPVMSELDFAYLLSKGKIVAITGTNGKTTTSMLVAKILKTAGYKTFLCGNIGVPFSSVVERMDKHSVAVCEVSNFQLETSTHFRANVTCILNVKPDHLDRHGSFEEYKKVKGKIAQNLKRRDVLILNLDDSVAKKMIYHNNYQFFSKNKLKKGVYAFQNQIYINKKSVLSLNHVALKGEKNLENVLSAVAICSHFHVSQEQFESAVSSFVPAHHRMELVGALCGVTYIDDSKATNVASTIACVEAYKNEKIWLLLGGLGKEIDYGELFSLEFPIKKVICFGSDREKISKSAQDFSYETKTFEKFAEAVLFCKENAESGDYVILSPACASFDEFSNYAERGEKFKNLVLGQDDEN